MTRTSLTVASIALAATLATAPAHARWNGSGANWHGGWTGGGWHHHHGGNAWPWIGGALLGLGAAGALLYAPPYYAPPPPPIYGYGGYAYPPPYYPPAPPYGYSGWRPY